MKKTRKVIKMRDFTVGRDRTAKGSSTVSVSLWKKGKGLSCRTERTAEKNKRVSLREENPTKTWMRKLEYVS